MLVSTIAHLSSLNAVNNIAQANIQNNQNLTDKAFKGDNNSTSLHKYELPTRKNIFQNTLLYKLASKVINNNKKLDYFA